MVVSWVSGVKKTNIMPEMNAKAIPNLIGNITGKSSPIFPNIPLETHPIRTPRFLKAPPHSLGPVL
jgi:hypothetical protein